MVKFRESIQRFEWLTPPHSFRKTTRILLIDNFTPFFLKQILTNKFYDDPRMEIIPFG